MIDVRTLVRLRWTPWPCPLRTSMKVQGASGHRQSPRRLPGMHPARAGDVPCRRSSGNPGRVQGARHFHHCTVAGSRVSRGG